MARRIAEYGAPDWMGLPGFRAAVVEHYVSMEYELAGPPESPGSRLRLSMKSRLHLIEGVLIAMENWEEVSRRIFLSRDRAAARDALAAPPLSLSPEQAGRVLDTPAGQRTAEGRRQLLEERDGLWRSIREQSALEEDS